MSVSAALDPNAALMALKSALKAKYAVIKTCQGAKTVRRQVRTHPNFLAVEMTQDGQSAFGLHPPSVRKALGRCVADIAIGELQARGLLTREKGTARPQTKLPGVENLPGITKKPRLLKLDVSWLNDD